MIETGTWLVLISIQNRKSPKGVQTQPTSKRISFPLLLQNQTIFPTEKGDLFKHLALRIPDQALTKKTTGN